MLTTNLAIPGMDIEFRWPLCAKLTTLAFVSSRLLPVQPWGHRLLFYYLAAIKFAPARAHVHVMSLRVHKTVLKFGVSTVHIVAKLVPPPHIVVYIKTNSHTYYVDTHASLLIRPHIYACRDLSTTTNPDEQLAHHTVTNIYGGFICKLEAAK